MCLEKIEQQFDPPQSEVREAWKVFLDMSYKDELWFPCEPGIVKFNTWVKARNTQLLTDNNPRKCYMSGYHSFSTLQDAKDHWMCRNGCGTILRVLVKDVRVVGTEGDSTVLVADWLLVPDPRRPTLEEMLALAEESWTGGEN